MKDKTEEFLLTSTKAALQLVPLVGGSIAEFVGHAWTSPTIRRLSSFAQHFEDVLRKRDADIAALQERVDQSEAAQVLIADVVAAVKRTTSEEQRGQLASLLANSLDSTDREIANATFLLRCWQELDDVEKLILVGLEMHWFDKENRTTRHPEVFGSDYFEGGDYQSTLAKDDLHRRRISHMVQLGVIVPVDPTKWRDSQLAYQFLNFRTSLSGDALLRLLKS